jgi:hypothetical protein
LFQGNSCFPLSPCVKDDKERENDGKDKDKDKDKKLHVISKNDQVKVILKDLGPQNEQDLSFLTSENAVQYVRELEMSAHKQTSETKLLQQRVSKMRTQLTSKMLEIQEIQINFLKLNPFFRMTSYESIKLKIFDNVRDSKKEKTLKALLLMKQEHKLAKTLGSKNSFDS